MKYDVVIVGGGLVGLTCALALAKQTSLTIAVLEASAAQPSWSSLHYSPRVSAITLASQRLFRSLGVWHAIQAKRVSPFTRIHVWDDNTAADMLFESQAIGESCLGYVIENELIQSVLVEAIREYPAVQYVSSAELTQCEVDAHGVRLTTKAGQCVEARLAVAADGAQSWLRQAVGIALIHQDYKQRAIVASVTTALPHEQVARQVFLDTGPLAFLPLSSPREHSIVWSVPTAEAEQLLQMDDAAFQHALAAAFHHRLGDITTVGKRYAFPLCKQQAARYVHARVALVGDAAHVVHPLAGQGVNMGLLDAAALVEVVTGAIQQQSDFAGHAVLRRYERWRRADNLAMQQGINGIKHVFASAHPAIQQARSLGLRLINRAAWVKNKLVSQAVGSRNGLPSLCLKDKCTN